MGEDVQQIIQKLDRIEQLTLIGAKSVLTIDEVRLLTGLSKDYLYRLTCNRQIPHFKKLRKLYFKKSEIEDWMLEHKIQTKEEIESNAATYIVTHK